MRIETKPVAAEERKILIVDDDPDSLEIIAEAFSWEGYQVKKISSSSEATELTKAWKPDLCILDVDIPEKDGQEALFNLKNMDPFMAVVFISANTTTEALIAGLDAGADDFIPKPFDPLELLARVRTQLRIKDLNDQLRTANEKLKELVDIDDLTGLFNMRSIYQRIEHELERGRRFSRPVCVVMLDMDGFKFVNDGHDHLFGSYVLSEVGRIIQQNIRNIDIGARYGGDEFLIVLTETNKEGAIIFCERLRRVIETTLFKNDRDKIRLTASLGFAITNPSDHIMDARALVRIADQALYEAKHSGRNCVKFTEVAPHLKTAKKQKAG
jgi:diguanylate cyclase (GGDEF)-like protein